ncbi:MAG: T9SS type A sorting domain-containing protein [Bacteroidales bacterium]|nr:T9SS type A sorting domain-containing protein [Bacteroidales bacterium]
MIEGIDHRKGVRYTSFMTPNTYVPLVDTTHTDPIDTGDVRITLVDDGTALVAYPNPFRQRVTIRIENSDLKTVNGVATAILTDLSGRREQVPLTPQGHSSNNTITQSSTYTLDLTSRPQSTYLLTLTTTTGHQHTLRLLKQADIFGR